MNTATTSTALLFSLFAARAAGHPTAAALSKPRGLRGPFLAAQPRVLFIDIDGVLHPTGDTAIANEPASSDTLFCWLPTLASALMSHADVSIVVHSTWRYMYKIDELRDILESLAPRVLGTTPLGPRYESIQWWLHLNPSFTNYRILDDDASEFPAPPPPELILCDPRQGVRDPRVLSLLTLWLEQV